MFDAYAAAGALRDAGFDETQAETAIAAIRDAISEGAATKEDATRPENEIDTGNARLEGEIDSDIADVRTDIGGLETSLAVRMYGGLRAAVVVLLAFLKFLP